MKLTFNNLSADPYVKDFFGIHVNGITLNFESRTACFFDKKGLQVPVVFYDYSYGGGVSHHSFRIPDPSGEGSVAVVIFDNGKTLIQDFLRTLPNWVIHYLRQ